MAKHERQVAHEFLANETLHGLATDSNFGVFQSRLTVELTC
jgi:hypothetical protein